MAGDTAGPAADPAAAAAEAAAAAAAVVPAPPAPGAIGKVGEAVAEEEGAKKPPAEGSTPTCIVDLRKIALAKASGPPPSDAGPVVDVFMHQLQAFVIDNTLVQDTKGTIMPQPPPDRGLDFVHLT